MTIPDSISLTEHVTSFELGAHVSGACFLGETVGFALGDGRVVLRLGEEAREIAAHAGAVQVSTRDAKALFTGGDDGRLLRIDASGAVETLADEKGKWIDAVALSPSGALAWSAGRSVKVRQKDGKLKEMTAPSSVRGLAFAPKGYRLAYAHNGGREPVVSERLERARPLRLEGFASRRHLLAGWALPRDLDAGERIARLEIGRQEAHADDGLSGEEPLALLVP